MNKKTSVMDIAFVFMGLVALVSLCGCDMHRDTWVSPNKMQVEQKEFFEQVTVQEASAGYIGALAQDYDKRGKGPLDLTVTYDPASKTNTAMRASNNASRIGAALRDDGVPEVNVSILPVHQSGGVSNVLVGYDSYTALPPKDCTEIAGINSTNIEADPDYKLGCSVNTALSQQIARPKDLAGSETDNPITDGRRSANIVERYRMGTPNKALEGETASE